MRARRGTLAVLEVALAVLLAVAAVPLWRWGAAPGGSGRTDARWWAGAVAVATVAGILLLDTARRSTTSPPSVRRADWEP